MFKFLQISRYTIVTSLLTKDSTLCANIGDLRIPARHSTLLSVLTGRSSQFEGIIGLAPPTDITPAHWCYTRDRQRPECPWCCLITPVLPPPLPGVSLYLYLTPATQADSVAPSTGDGGL